MLAPMPVLRSALIGLTCLLVAGCGDKQTSVTKKWATVFGRTFDGGHSEVRIAGNGDANFYYERRSKAGLISSDSDCKAAWSGGLLRLVFPKGEVDAFLVDGMPDPFQTEVLFLRIEDRIYRVNWDRESPFLAALKAGGDILPFLMEEYRLKEPAPHDRFH
jgi:hypothetical protein